MHNNIKQQIRDQLYTKTGNANSAILRREWFQQSELCHQILDITSFLNFKNPKFTERIWCIMHDIISHPKCVVCGNNVVFLPNANIGYSNICNNHSCMGTIGIEKAKQTRLKKYGNENYNNQEKIKQTNLERYGVETPFQSKEIQEKVKKIHLERYGVENPGQTVDHRFKSKQTLLKNYGVSHPSKIPEVIEKIKEKSISFYNGLASEDIKIKEYQTTIIGCNRIIFKCDKCNENHDIPSETFKWRCRNNLTPCPKCSPIKEGSNHQYQIYNYIKNLIPEKEIIVNDNSILSGRREIDIYIPKINLAIEYDGIYWHSFGEKETKKEKNLHLWKTEECEKQNIHLIHIFETEWINQQMIVKSRLSNFLGKNKRIYARNCKIVKINKVKKILEEYHIQGNCGSFVNYALTYNNEIVSIMTFGKSRFGKYEWELLRFASKPFTNVVGGANKLFKYFILQQNPISIVSYANRRWSYSKKSVYEKMDFKLKNISNPGYFYWRKKEGMILQNRIKFQKHKLLNLLEIFDNNLTESENMFNNGFRRIWDCGNLVFVWNN